MGHSDSDAPGIFLVLNYMNTLSYRVNPNCAPGRYYLLNNYNPGGNGNGNGNGNDAYTDTDTDTNTNAHNTVFTVPPSNVPRFFGDQGRGRGMRSG
jgi:phospholipase C